MTGNRIVLAVLVLLFTGPLAAGPTLFGTGPRTLWEGGKDIQFDTVVSYQHRMFEHDHPISNPRD
ncbi:MAG: hypothetical protein OEY28_13870, partial [Nitrospira sp.]|nr:hypothetical protein [Nitrospira sp.]